MFVSSIGFGFDSSMRLPANAPQTRNFVITSSIFLESETAVLRFFGAILQATTRRSR
jgi:hypothetical protein